MPDHEALDRDALVTVTGGWQHLGLPNKPDPTCAEMQASKDIDDEIVSHKSFWRWEFGRRSRWLAEQMTNKGCSIAPNKYED